LEHIGEALGKVRSSRDHLSGPPGALSPSAGDAIARGVSLIEIVGVDFLLLVREDLRARARSSVPPKVGEGKGGSTRTTAQEYSVDETFDGTPGPANADALDVGEDILVGLDLGVAVAVGLRFRPRLQDLADTHWRSTE